MKENGATKHMRETVIDTDLCTLCGACVNLCPYYTSYNDRLVVLDECDRIDDTGCLDVCPRTPTDLSALSRLLFEENDLTPEAGAIKAFYITRACDPEVRKNAQHGGTVTALMELALKEGLIDIAVLSGAGEPMLPHGVTAAAGQVGRSGKSRFVVTSNVAKFNEVAREGARAVGIVATPCQTLALAKMRMSRNPRIKENSSKIRLVIGLFCGWAFSSSAFQEMLSRNVDLNSIVGMDIPPSKYHTLDVYTTGGTVSISLDEVVKCVRPACHYCSDMTSEFSDISVGSARLPEGWEEARSWNQVIVRTEAGRRLMDLARSKGVLEFRDVPEGNLERLKNASMGKKKTGAENLKAMAAGKE